VLLLLASFALHAQGLPPARPKLADSLAARSATSPDELVIVHLLLNPAALYRAGAEASASRTAGRRPSRTPDLLADAAAMRIEVASRAAQLLSADDFAVTAAVNDVNGRVVYHALSVADVVAIVPASGLQRLAALPQVREIVEDIPMQGGLDVSVPAVGANSFWNAGEYGTSVKVGILDSGVDLSNPAFNGVVAHSAVYLTSAQAVDFCYVDQADADDRQGHGSHVAGIVFSRGASQCANCKGVANGAELFNLKTGYKSSCSSTPSTRWADVQQAVGDTPAISVYNMSYGTPYTCDGNNVKYSCDDDAQAQEWDTTVDTKGQAVAIGAGNDAANGGANTLWAPSIAYNVMSVANVDDKTSLSRSDDSIFYSSSYGPTAGGRKKPDISAPGTSIQSANYNWESGSQFVRGTGTSMAAPHVAGALALLLNAAAAENIPALLDPRSLKAVLINTAELRGGNTGWDSHWGWGYLDIASAYQHRKAVFLDSVTAGGAGSAHLYAGSTVGNPGKATLVWNRHPYNSYSCPGGALALNNLDLFAYNEADGSLLASSTSTADNVEQVIERERTGVVLRVAAVCSGFSAAEPYALATENGFASAAPALRLNLAPQNFPSGGHASVSIEAFNEGAIAAHDVQVTLNLPAGMSLDSGTPAVTIPHLAAHSSALLYWNVGAPTTTGFYGPNASAVSSSYGVTFSATAVQNWSVGSVETFVLTLVRPARPHRLSSSQDVVAGQERAFDIFIAGAPSPAAISAHCEVPDGMTCNILPKNKRAGAASRRLIVKIRPALDTRSAKYTATVTVESSAGSGSIELPFEVRTAKRAHQPVLE
jgi:subtilisin family serine protease